MPPGGQAPEAASLRSWRRLHRAETDSTNALAARELRAGRLGPGDVVTADRQTAGRGRHGRVWVTAPGRSLAASFLLEEPRLARPSRVAVLGAVAACRALRRAGVSGDLRVKWPNDLMLGERKIGGVLIEGVADAAGARRLVLGIGLNLALEASDLPPELRDVAGSAGLDAGTAARETLVEALREELGAALAEIGGPGDRERGEEYRHSSWLNGRRVVLLAEGRRVEARIAGVTADGDLRLDDGRLLRGETVDLLEVERHPPLPCPPPSVPHSTPHSAPHSAR